MKNIRDKLILTKLIKNSNYDKTINEKFILIKINQFFDIIKNICENSRLTMFENISNCDENIIKMNINYKNNDENYLMNDIKFFMILKKVFNFSNKKLLNLNAINITNSMIEKI